MVGNVAEVKEQIDRLTQDSTPETKLTWGNIKFN
jgi:hypothetical protein